MLFVSRCHWPWAGGRGHAPRSQTWRLVTAWWARSALPSRVQTSGPRRVNCGRRDRGHRRGHTAIGRCARSGRDREVLSQRASSGCGAVSEVSVRRRSPAVRKPDESSPRSTVESPRASAACCSSSTPSASSVPARLRDRGSPVPVGRRAIAQIPDGRRPPPRLTPTA
jgi:hypothetical protein